MALSTAASAFTSPRRSRAKASRWLAQPKSSTRATLPGLERTRRSAIRWGSCASIWKAPVPSQPFAVRRATLSMYQHGVASEDDGRLLADLSPSPAFEKLVEASGGYGECVTKPAELPAAIERALAVVTREKRQALLNVMCRY